MAGMARAAPSTSLVELAPPSSTTEPLAASRPPSGAHVVASLPMYLGAARRGTQSGTK